MKWLTDTGARPDTGKFDAQCAIVGELLTAQNVKAAADAIDAARNAVAEAGRNGSLSLRPDVRELLNTAVAQARGPGHRQDTGRVQEDDGPLPGGGPRRP